MEIVIPDELRPLKQWCTYNKHKNPVRTDGAPSRVNTPADWETLEAVLAVTKKLGFQLAPPYVGIDLDNCRDPFFGTIEPWARDIIEALDSYTQMSPSGYGVHIICTGKNLLGWAKREVPFGRDIKGDDNSPKVEVYDKTRFFRWSGKPIHDRPIREINYAEFKAAAERHTRPAIEHPTLEPQLIQRARNYVAAMPAPVNNKGGSTATYNVARILRREFDFPRITTFEILKEDYNRRCIPKEPKWTDKELWHKIDSVEKCRLENPEKIGIARGNRLENEPPPKFSMRVLSDTEFMGQEFKQDWQIENVLVRGQPLIIGGPPKALKTSIAVDMVCSLRSGHPFLGKFKVVQQCNTLIVSGELAGKVLQDLVARVKQSKGLPRALEGLYWCTDLPQLAHPDHVSELKRHIEATQAGFVLVDPAYLALLAGVRSSDVAANNLMQMGPLLRSYGEIGLECNATMVLCHHQTKASAKKNEPPTIADLAFSGFGEWARQWFMISRRGEYYGGVHQMWCRIGGSAGHNSAWEVDIDEGCIDFDGPDDGDSGRVWNVIRCDPWTPGGRDDRRVEPSGDDVERVYEIIRQAEEPVTARFIRNETNIQFHAVNEIISQLIEDGKIGRTNVVIGGREWVAYW